MVSTLPSLQGDKELGGWVFELGQTASEPPRGGGKPSDLGGRPIRARVDPRPPLRCNLLLELARRRGPKGGAFESGGDSTQFMNGQIKIV